MLSSASWNTSTGARLRRPSTRSKRVVDDAFGDGFLAVDHQVVHELGQNAVAELGVGQDFAFFGA
jgi:hypothetical protein